MTRALVCLASVLVACASVEDQAAVPTTAAGSTTAPPSGTKPDGPNTPDPEPPQDLGLIPKLFVRGALNGVDAVEDLRSFDTYKQLFTAAGFDGARHAHDLGDYDDSKSMAEMVAEIGQRVEAAMAPYPSSTKFDVLGHSLGGVVALRAIVDRNLTPRVRTFVALSAPIYGQDKKPFNCKLGFRCTDLYTVYTPFRSAPVMAYMDEHKAALDSLVRCSVISPDDGVIDAPTAGAQFPDGTNVSVPKVSHMKLMKSEVAFAAMTARCFDNKL